MSKPITILFFFSLVFACQSNDDSDFEAKELREDSIIKATDLDPEAIQDSIDSIKSNFIIQNMSGIWFRDEPIINTKNYNPDMDTMFDVDSLRMRRLKGSFDESFHGLVFWLERDSTLKLATNYKLSDARGKEYWEIYSNSVYEVSIWHHSISENTLILEFHFYDGVKEVSKIHYEIRAIDENNIDLIRTKNTFWASG